MSSCTATTREQNDVFLKKGLKSKPQLIAEVLYQHRPDATVVLDVGYAQYPNRFLRGQIYGVDIYAEEVPENYHRVDAADFNTCTLPYEDHTFDAITMGCVLAHITNPLGFLIELHRVLKPNGVIVLSSPNPNYYWEQALNVFFHYFKSRVAKVKFLEHFYEFTRYNMRTITARAGFSMLGETGVSFHLVKFGLSFQPLKYPGIAYEIIYALEKTGEPELFTICELPTGNRRLPTAIK